MTLRIAAVFAMMFLLGGCAAEHWYDYEPTYQLLIPDACDPGGECNTGKPPHKPIKSTIQDAVSAPASFSGGPLFISDYVKVLRLLSGYRRHLDATHDPSRALLMGFFKDTHAPLIDILGFGGFDPFGIANYAFPKTDHPYVRGDYEAMPFGGRTFALVVAPELHLWHIEDNVVVIANDMAIAQNLAWIIAPRGFFICNTDELHGFALHLVRAGFSRLDIQEGYASVWQRDAEDPANHRTPEETVRQMLERSRHGRPFVVKHSA